MIEEFSNKECAKCHGEIEVNLNELDNGNIIRYKTSYYHRDCFIERAKDRIAKKSSIAASWQEALDNIDQLARDTNNTIQFSAYRDELDRYLRAHYGVASFSKRFWNTITDIGNGNYKKRSCTPIYMGEFVDMWKYFQKGLDKVHQRNIDHGKKMTGEIWALYDLAIIMTKYGDYQDAKAKEKARAAEQRFRQEHRNKINYESLYKQTQENKEAGIDILSLMNDIWK